jgi:hypothetical protein
MSQPTNETFREDLKKAEVLSIRVRTSIAQDGITLKTAPMVKELLELSRKIYTDHKALLKSAD